MRSFWRGTDDPVSRFAQRSYAQVWNMVWRSLRIAVIDKNGLTSSIVTRLNVPPTVADHETGCQIDIVLSSRFQQHSRQRLAAVTLVLVGVVADKNIVEGKTRAIKPRCMASSVCRDCFPRATSGWLVTTSNLKPFAFSSRKSLRNAGKYFQLLQCRRRKWFAVANKGPVDHAVAVKKHGAAAWHSPPSIPISSAAS